jgi:hypothetical protein
MEVEPFNELKPMKIPEHEKPIVAGADSDYFVGLQLVDVVPDLASPYRCPYSLWCG